MSRLIRLLTVLLLAATGLPALAGGPTDPAEDLAAAMVDRLLLMEGVAQYKWNHAAPIEDLEREKLVLDAAVTSAKAEGVPVALATDFFQAQITAAKVIQARYFALWKQESVGTLPGAPDLKTELRPAIGALTGRIIRSLSGLDSMDAADLCAALSPVPPPLAEDAEAWRTATAPLRHRAGGC